ncbi:LamG domain-containing protein [Clostridium sp. Cult3]|uniref:LamG domain-containing protein n=1 Tax=Clostridium sp. Cult3 TaxID=2079004 RepID=UPI001F200FD2|nr:LamG domain-containing protein [Clostridium sp. Cult3]MCF6461504.1 hypothetical protein [Clostridium sp. Cult3]
MKNGQSKSIWKDLSGNGNDGQLMNFDFTEDSGWVDGGLRFDGVDDYVEVDDNDSLNSDSFTIDIVINELEDIPLTKKIITKSNVMVNGFDIYTYVNYIYIVLYNNGTRLTAYKYSKIGTNKGNSLTFTYSQDNQTLTIYLNGDLWSEKNDDDFIYKPSINPIRIGNLWNGIFHSLRLYNRALTYEEILQNYRATHFLLEPKTFTSTSYYNFYDLNRVEINTLATKDLAEVLRGDINLESINFDRDMKSIPFADVLNRVEGNINILGNKLYKPKGWIQPKLDWRYNQPFSYEDANRLEYNLLLLYNYAKGNIDKIPYCGAYTCGEEVI